MLVSSIHIDPELDYPYNTGYRDQTGAGPGLDATDHRPLGRGTTGPEYLAVLGAVIDRIVEFGANAIVVSLGLDTLRGDPECTPLGGFALDAPNDYVAMGEMIRAPGLPVRIVLLYHGAALQYRVAHPVSKWGADVGVS